MRIYKILFFLAVVLTACKSKAPNDIIGQPEMAALLTDVHIADGSTYANSQIPDSLYIYNIAKYLYVFKAHHTDSVQFRKSFTYYTHEPDKLNDIYEQVIKNLKFKTDSITKEQTAKAVKAAKDAEKATKEAQKKALKPVPQPEARPQLQQVKPATPTPNAVPRQ